MAFFAFFAFFAPLRLCVFARKKMEALPKLARKDAKEQSRKEVKNK
jgi:hypothetical protein